MSGYEDERKSSSKSPFDEQIRDARILNYNRPLTAKRNEYDFAKNQKKTLIRFDSRQKKIVPKEKTGSTLSKLKPTKISVDKEKLYSENMALKVKNNELKVVLTKFKSKILQLERELQKKDDIVPTNMTSNTYLIKLLKQNIKDLRSEIQNKDQTIVQQKKNMKLSNFLEMELEVKAYRDECTRLRHFLEETLQEKVDNNRMSIASGSQDLKTIDLLKIIEGNNKEIFTLKEKLKSENKQGKTPRFNEEIEKIAKEYDVLKKELQSNEHKLNKKIEKLKKTNSDTLKELSVEKLKLGEANCLVETLYKELKSLRQKKKSKIAAPKLLQVLNHLIASQNISLSDFLEKFSSKKQSFIEQKPFFNSLKSFDSSIASEDLESIIHYIKHDTSSKISIKRLLDYFNSFDFSVDLLLSKSHKATILFEHLCLRMQLHRIPKENLIEALIGAGASSSKIIHSQEIVLLFTNSPFSFSRNQATAMVEFLFGTEKTQSYSAFIDKFYSVINDWEIYTAADEENFDTYLLAMVSKNKDEIEVFCSGKDLSDKGVVTVEQFYQCLEALKIILPDRVSGYLLVLFYSHNMELGLVPYKQFLQAYSNTDEGATNGDYKMVLIQKYLEQIASKVTESKLRIKEVFWHDENGFMVAEDFIKGLGKLNITDISQENLLILLEALQYDPEERVVCIHINELEEILETYGVPLEHNDTSEILSDSEVLAEITEGHIQRISMLDSGLIHLNDTPEPGPRANRISF